MSNADQPLSPKASVWLATLMAALVFGGGVFVAEGGMKAVRAWAAERGRPLKARAPVASASVEAMAPAGSMAKLVSTAPIASTAPIFSAAPIASTAPLLSAAPIASTAPLLSAAPIASTAPVGSTAPGGAPATPSVSASAAVAAPIAADLPEQTGYLTVRGLSGRRVYVNGTDIGATNDVNQAPCGQRFVRLGTKPSRGIPRWFGPGQSVRIACQGATEVTLRGEQ